MVIHGVVSAARMMEVAAVSTNDAAGRDVKCESTFIGIAEVIDIGRAAGVDHVGLLTPKLAAAV